MKHVTKLKLAAVHQLCDVEDRSTEYTMQIMQNIVKVDLDTVIKYFKLGEDIHSTLFREVNEIGKVMIDAELTIPRL